MQAETLLILTWNLFLNFAKRIKETMQCFLYSFLIKLYDVVPVPFYRYMVNYIPKALILDQGWGS